MHSAVHANIFMKLDYEVSQMRITWQDGTIKKKKEKLGTYYTRFRYNNSFEENAVFFYRFSLFIGSKFGNYIHIICFYGQMPNISLRHIKHGKIFKLFFFIGNQVCS